jgi:hypothetical protein
VSPTIGRNIRYVLPTGPQAGEARLGFITNVLDNGKVSITCLPDAANDRVGQIYSAMNVAFSDSREPGTWHWPTAVQP